MAAWFGLALGGCGPARAQQVRIEVTRDGFTPPVVTVRRGQAVRITFARRIAETCGTDVVFPALHRGYDLPLGQDVRVDLSAAEVGDTLRFSCSTDIAHGMLVAR